MSVQQLNLSGYEASKELVAQRYYRDGKGVYVIALPISLISSHLPIPDPAQPFEGNRTVNVSHAASFGDYWLENRRWAAPPLLLDTNYPLSAEFDTKLEAGGVQFGVVKLPHNSNEEFQILDGQHRILGWTMAIRKVLDQLKQARESLQLAKQSDDANGITLWQKKVDGLVALQQRAVKEHVTLEIWEGVSAVDHKQAFHDIAVNAKGITKSVTMRFDQRVLLNRVAQELTQSVELLDERVDPNVDTVRGSSPYLISGKTLVDIVRATAIGISGYMTRRRKSAFKDAAIEKIGRTYFETLVDCFPDFQTLAAGEESVVELRKRSLLGSSTVLRVLAGVFHDVAVDLSDEDHPHVSAVGLQRVRKLFGDLAPHMHLPIAPEWVDTTFFPGPDSRAPSSRTQDLRGLTAEIGRWATDGVPFA